MARRDPHLWVHEDAGIEPDDVVALLDHRPPPCPLDVVLELDPERTVIPDRVDAAVDLARREDEAAALGERDDRVELGDGGRDRIRVGRAGVGHVRLLIGRPAVAWTAARGSVPAMLAEPPAHADEPPRPSADFRVLTAPHPGVHSVDRPISVIRPTEERGGRGSWRTRSRDGSWKSVPATCCARAGSARTPTTRPVTPPSPGASRRGRSRASTSAG